MDSRIANTWGTAAAALALAVLSFAFFLVTRATSTLNPVVDTPAFLNDVVAHRGAANLWTWGQALLGLVGIATAIGLHRSFGPAGSSLATIGAAFGVVWAAGLLLVTPVQLVAFSVLGPDSIGSGDTVATTAAAEVTRGLLWMVVTQVTVVFVLRALSVAAFSVLLLRAKQRAWRAIGWLGIAFSIEHLAAAVLHQVDQVGGVTTALGALGGLLFTVWLVGLAAMLLRQREMADVATAPAAAGA